jgi:hypothetical protein
MRRLGRAPLGAAPPRGFLERGGEPQRGPTNTLAAGDEERALEPTEGGPRERRHHAEQERADEEGGVGGGWAAGTWGNAYDQDGIESGCVRERGAIG